MNCIELNEGTSRVRIFHATSKIFEVDVYINDEKKFENIIFGDFTKYIELKEGSYKVDIYLANDNKNPIISQRVDIPNKKMLTLAITGDLNDLSLLVIPDRVEKIPLEDASIVRVIHLSEDTPSVDLIINGETLFDNLEFRQGTEYIKVTPSTYYIKVVINTNQKVILPLKINLKANRIYTIYVVNDTDNISAIQVVDGNTYLCR